MFREIKKKQIILENRKPYSFEVQEFIQEMNLTDWVYSSLRLDGSSLDKVQMETILKGGFVERVSLSDHVMIERYRDLVQNAADRRQISSDLSLDTILTFQKILSGEQSAPYRRENPVLIALDYNPPHPSEIEEQMEILMNWFYAEDPDANPIMKAAAMHHRIIEIYPFESFTEATARAAMYYYLMTMGFPPFAITLSEQEYNGMLMAYLKRGEMESFYQSIERSLFNKMEVLMQLTADE